MIAAENVQRKIAIVLVIAMEEAAELVAVDRVVGGVEVQNDPLGGRGVGLEEEGDQEPFDVMGVADDLLVAALVVGADGREFEAVERALAGQRLAAVAKPLPGLPGGIALADDGGEQGVGPEVVVVVEVFVAQRQAVDALGEEFLQRVFNEVGIAMIGETACELADDAGEFLGLAEQ